MRAVQQLPRLVRQTCTDFYATEQISFFLFLKINIRKIFNCCCLYCENFVEYVIDLQLKVC